jgi:hypothetical protein
VVFPLHLNLDSKLCVGLRNVLPCCPVCSPGAVDRGQLIDIFLSDSEFIPLEAFEFLLRSCKGLFCSLEGIWLGSGKVNPNVNDRCFMTKVLMELVECGKSRTCKV